MIKQDYSEDAVLKANEIDDFDTIDYKNGEEHPTGINADRMRLPTRYDIAKFYLRQRRNPERGKWVERKRKLNFSRDFEWQITYRFPATVRKNKTAWGKKYGGSHVTYRRLYLILCEHLNGGRYFVDDYFNSVYPHTIKPEIDAYLKDIKSFLLQTAGDFMEGAVATTRGKIDRRVSANQGMQEKLDKFTKLASQFEDSFGDIIADRIKEDIISCLASGQIPLAFGNEPSTKARRVAVGLEPDPRFYATAQLINHIQLFVKIGDNGTWKTRQGILV